MERDRTYIARLLAAGYVADWQKLDPHRRRLFVAELRRDRIDGDETENTAARLALATIDRMAA